jgi:hypothetical protein
VRSQWSAGVNPANDSENIRAARRALLERYLRIAILSGTSAAYGGIGGSTANWQIAYYGI